MLMYKYKGVDMKKVVIIMILFSAFILACGNPASDPDPCKDYYGTWKLTNRYDTDEWDILIISSNKIEYNTSDGAWDYTTENLTWTPYPNETDSVYYDDYSIYYINYPTGFKISGTLTEKRNGSAPLNSNGEEGDIGETVFDYFYISIDGNSLMAAFWDYEYHEAAYGPFYK